MRYTLKDYQAEAVRDVLANLVQAHDMYDRYQSRSQFSLSAATGAGKTVMLAGVLEALFEGSDEFDFAPDTGASVLWFSDDPALNLQSMQRIQAAAPSLYHRSHIIEFPFPLSQLEPGNIYFLNTQKLSKNSKLVRSEGTRTDSEESLFRPAPDMLQTSIYEVLSNTIKAEGRTLYMVLDEAHRGMQPQKDRQTIVRRLINGHGAIPAIPIVLGISATVERFEKAMKDAEKRTALPSVEVDPVKVQASGLLKDDIVLSIPAESGTFDTVLLTRAVEKLRAASLEWQRYAKAQPDASLVTPLLVVQMGDKPTTEELTRVLDTIFHAWPELPTNCVANVFGEHQDLHAGGYTIPYEEPQRIQDATWCRVLLAKTAISNGWDCPRAEVLISFRAASDPTHITQLLGRMIRTPLARRIPGNELLNSVDCLLPFFDRNTAMNVADMLMAGATGKDSDTGGGEGRRILFDPVTLKPNQEMPNELWEKFVELPSTTIPRAHVKPIKRLTALAAALSKDGIKPGAVEEAFTKINAVLDGRRVQYATQLAEKRKDVETMRGEELRRQVGGLLWQRNAFEATVDLRAVEASYRASARTLSPAIANAYVNHLSPSDDEDELLEAHITVAAMGLIPEVVVDLETEADKIAREWLTKTRVARTSLSDEEKTEYERLEGMAQQPETTALERPHATQADTKVREADGSENELPTDTKHLLVAKNGSYPLDLNDWETKVLRTEEKRETFLGWYRNPDRGVRESLAIAYQENGAWKALRPDFLFFHEINGEIICDIVDPHGYHLADALPKLRGLVDYAERHGSQYRRIEAIAEVDGQLRVLDLKRKYVRQAIRQAGEAKMLYASDLAHDYQ